MGIEKLRYVLAYEMMDKMVNVHREEVTVQGFRMLLGELQDSLPWSIRLDIAHSGNEGFAYLNFKSIIHRDVKVAKYFTAGGPSNSVGIV